MARPQKKGIDYFPLDVTMDKTNDDIEMLEAKYVTNGFKTIIKLYMKIYQEEGYFVEWNEKSSLLLAKRVNADINEVNSIINDLVHWGVFNLNLFKTHSILTSKRIQKTYLEAVKKRKEVDIIESLLLVEKINDNINLINSGIYPQSKVKKIIVNESKVKYYDGVELNDLFLSFLKQRKQLKAINSELAIKGLLNKLEPFEDNVKYVMINESIISSWKSVFPLKKEKLDHYKKVLPKDIESDWLDDYINSL